MQRELHSYQAAVREQADLHGCVAAVFQGDFLLVKLPSRGVQLHRVANGLFMMDALEPDIRFTTAEYEHIPQDGVDGLWGTFEPAMNTNFDPTDKKSGTKFARHHDVGRDAVVLYDVQVRVSLRSSFSVSLFVLSFAQKRNIHFSQHNSHEFSDVCSLHNTCLCATYYRLLE